MIQVIGESSSSHVNVIPLFSSHLDVGHLSEHARRVLALVHLLALLLPLSIPRRSFSLFL